MAGEIQEQVFHRKPSPLPRTQLANALLINLCSSLSQLSILPFISQVNIPSAALERLCPI